MTLSYSETIEYLYKQTPQFQLIGAAAYKPGLDTVTALAERFGNPHHSLKIIHIGGTNGKGSTAHSIASVLQCAGYKVGLFTSPHLTDFRERIKINGNMIPRDEVTAFVSRFREMQSSPDTAVPTPSFFELTTVMAFDYFARNNVDYAVIEVGLGGRLDSTNIIDPILSVITNISKDHVAQLGHTLTQIASEKAGIIKPGMPVVIGEARGEVKYLFIDRAAECDSPIYFADEVLRTLDIKRADEGLKANTGFGPVCYGLTGYCQENNLKTILTTLDVLRRAGVRFDDAAVASGLRDVVTLTGLSGRWMRVCDTPLIVCDTGHNEGGWQYISRQLEAHDGQVIAVLGFVNDKDVTHILPLIPERCKIIYTRASVPRAMDEQKLADIGRDAGRPGDVAHTLSDAMTLARERANESGVGVKRPLIFVGGSTFLVADLLAIDEGAARKNT